MRQSPGNLLLGRQRKDTTFIEQIKRQYPAEVQFLTFGKSYRPIRIGLDQLQLINKTLKGVSHG